MACITSYRSTVERRPSHDACFSYYQVLGFQRAKAEEIFAESTSLQFQSENSTKDLVRLAEVYITAADVAAEENAQTEGQPIEDDVTRCISLVWDYMGIEFEGVRLDLIDEPDRPVFLSRVREWVLKTTVRRYHFLCRLDSIFRKFEIALQRLEETEEERQKQKEATGELDPAAAVEDAKQMARNRKRKRRWGLERQMTGRLKEMTIGDRSICSIKTNSPTRQRKRRKKKK